MRNLAAMREIIFRGKRFDNGEWATGFLLPFPDDVALMYERDLDDKEVVGTTSVDVDQKTVGEYTGILDKDGNRIFEGDIVECVSWNEYFSDPTTGKVMEPFRRKMEVVFMAGGFKLVEHLPQPCKDNVWNMIVEGDLTVIGNIHDNPELLN